jgi:hypothetical protein
MEQKNGDCGVGPDDRPDDALAGRAQSRAQDRPRDAQGKWVSPYVTTGQEGHAVAIWTPPDGFDAAKQDKFFEALASGLNIAAAAKAAGVHRNTVADHRRRDPAFRQRFAEVLSEAYHDLELRLLAMALNGVRQKTVMTRIGDKKVETLREGDDGRVALGLMQLHHAMVAAHEAARDTILVTPQRPDKQQFADWLLAEIEAAEAENADRGSDDPA